MTAAEFLALAARCESEEPSSKLDEDIGLATGIIDGEMGHYWSRPFTTSLDAAVTLVPEGMAWTAGCEPDFTPFARLWEHDLVWASTPALALCAAALSARASLV